MIDILICEAGHAGGLRPRRASAGLIPGMVGRVSAGVLIGVVAGVFLLGISAAAAQESGSSARIEQLVEQAKDHGAKGALPMAWRDLEQGYDQAVQKGATEAQWASLEAQARRLVNMAVFVEEMRRQKSGLEAMLGRFDQALREIAALSGVAAEPTLSGTGLARSLLADLEADRRQQQAAIDSLTVANRHLTEVVGSQAAAQDSLITALQVEVSSLRRKLWETELRAGVAEADRSAAESVLTRKQQKEAAVQEIRASLTPQEGEILLTPEGEILLRVHGIAFGVGQSEPKSGQQALVAKVAAAVGRFPGAQVRVDGHTDNTGGREANLQLSLRRAETVARLLEQRLDLARGTIATGGFGPDRPVSLNDTAEGRALNRRIDVLITPAP